MKKKYYMVHIINGKENSYIPFLCESITKIDTQTKGEAYIFRDLITGRIIRPYYDTSTNIVNSIDTLTYDNINKNSYKRISQKEVLKFLKELNNEIIDFYQITLNNIEKKNIKSLTI